MKPRYLVAAVVLAICMPIQAATEVISLSHRMAEDILPIAQSVVGNEGKVNGYGNQLIVNAPDAVIAELRDVIGQLDKEPKRLLISVDTQNAASESQRGYRVDSSGRIGDVEIKTGRGEVTGRDQVRIIRHSTTSQGGGVQQVQATEGYPALIQVGQSVPVTTTVTDSYGQPYQQTQYRDVMRGFYATATTNGDRVQVIISSNNDRISRAQPGAIHTQAAETRVSGQVGEWIILGGLDENSTSDHRGIVRRHATQGRENTTLKLKIDILD